MLDGHYLLHFFRVFLSSEVESMFYFSILVICLKKPWGFHLRGIRALNYAILYSVLLFQTQIFSTAPCCEKNTDFLQQILLKTHWQINCYTTEVCESNMVAVACSTVPSLQIIETVDMATKRRFAGSIEGSSNSARYWTAAAYRLQEPILQEFDAYSALHAG